MEELSTVPTSQQKLFTVALAAREKAYAPYSNYKVGAALLTRAGNIYEGCNIENISFTPTVCAERTAIFSAIVKGEYEFESILVVTDEDNPGSPCGVCMQVMSEFVPKDFPIYLANPSGKVIATTFGKLFTRPFSSQQTIGQTTTKKL